MLLCKILGADCLRRVLSSLIVPTNIRCNVLMHSVQGIKLVNSLRTRDIGSSLTKKV